MPALMLSRDSVPLSLPVCLSVSVSVKGLRSVFIENHGKHHVGEE